MRSKSEKLIASTARSRLLTKPSAKLYSPVRVIFTRKWTNLETQLFHLRRAIFQTDSLNFVPTSIILWSVVVFEDIFESSNFHELISNPSLFHKLFLAPQTVFKVPVLVTKLSKASWSWGNEESHDVKMWHNFLLMKDENSKDFSASSWGKCIIKINDK